MFPSRMTVPFNRPLRILHVLDHSLPLHSGYAFRSANILREQLSLGWKPVVVTSPKHDLAIGKQCEMEDTIAGVKHYRTPAGKSRSVQGISEFGLMRGLKARLEELVQKEKPDIVHAHSPILNAFPSLWMRRRFGVPVVYEVRAFWEDAAVDHGSYGQDSVKYRVVRNLETLVCKAVDEVVILSEGLKEDLIRRGVAPQKLTLIGNGIHPPQFEDRGPRLEYRKRWGLTDNLVIGFIGSFYRYEGLDLLIEAMTRLVERWPDLNLLLVGEGEVETELKRIVHNLQLGSKVIIPGRIPHDEVRNIYDLADVLVYPRRSMRLTEIVTPLKPLEAMAMGKAILASDVGGHKELIGHGHTGLLFQADNLAALVAGLETLLKDKDLRSKIGTAAASWVRRERSWKKLIERQGEVYARALFRRR